MATDGLSADSSQMSRALRVKGYAATMYGLPRNRS